MKKILVILTNTTRYGQTTAPTGLWLGEATEFVEEVVKAEFQVDYVSPKGGFVPLDPRSMKYVDESIMRVYESNDFQQRALIRSLAAKDVNGADYSAIYFTGGHGVMWDFPNDVNLQRLTRTIYENGGFVTAVCHGIAGLLNVKLTSGQYLISGKHVTGFTLSEELIAGKRRVVPFLNQQVAESHGAKFEKKRAYKTFAVRDGQLITGQNPFSAQAVAEKLISAIG
ncbi:type 1 glutamine amidotransferase domain-containing protein [Lactiplantibacillus garii]|uniref:Type 1 glutamine amidotransferase domain-containing protein n=1 Tax=Lactiplantibacillus garii TaxID=2306423 RepID=A0A426D5U2_9LACO|nr:type 1 glutamine amidotransferase domain-containing protein [Lactiplantibacillus garii]RRK10016.1 type 1 glutamine amidotransferase domain-containing protein [Lactiplantibacillus garii]